MPQNPFPLKVSAAKRLIGAVQKKGLVVGSVSVGPDGTISIHTADSATTANHANPWDEVLTDVAHQERAT